MFTRKACELRSDNMINSENKSLSGQEQFVETGNREKYDISARASLKKKESDEKLKQLLEYAHMRRKMNGLEQS